MLRPHPPSQTTSLPPRIHPERDPLIEETEIQDPRHPDTRLVAAPADGVRQRTHGKGGTWRCVYAGETCAGQGQYCDFGWHELHQGVEISVVV